MSDNQVSTLPQGFFLKPPHEKAPDWVKGQIGIKVEDAIEYLKQHENERGYVNLDLKESKQGKLYLDLNVYKKPESTAPDQEDPF